MTVRPMLAAFLLGTTMLSAAADAGPLPNGIEAANGSAKIQVTALTDSILRVRIGKGGAFAENASWAVPAAVRKQSAPVTATTGESRIGRQAGRHRPQGSDDHRVRHRNASSPRNATKIMSSSNTTNAVKVPV